MPYIAIEGVKGVGKTSLIEHLIGSFRSAQLAAPTRPAGECLSERVLAALPCLEKLDLFREWVYLQRARHALAVTNWDSPLILGDRSLITALATRWEKWGNPDLCLRRVAQQLPGFPIPDHIIYLDAPTQVITARLAARGRTYGRPDEARDRIETTKRAYSEIRSTKSFGLHAIQWHTLDTDRPLADVIQEARRILRSIEIKE